jgi:uncharacterized protein
VTLCIADTSALLAAYDNASLEQGRVRSLLSESVAVVSPLVLDELDHLLVARFGKDRRVANMVLNDVLQSADEGAVLVAAVDVRELRLAQEVVNHYSGLRLDLGDAVNVVLADRYVTDSILTLDIKDFRALRPLTAAYSAFYLPIQDGF